MKRPGLISECEGPSTTTFFGWKGGWRAVRFESSRHGSIRKLSARVGPFQWVRSKSHSFFSSSAAFGFIHMFQSLLMRLSNVWHAARVLEMICKQRSKRMLQLDGKRKHKQKTWFQKVPNMFPQQTNKQTNNQTTLWHSEFCKRDVVCCWLYQLPRL